LKVNYKNAPFLLIKVSLAESFDKMADTIPRKHASILALHKHCQKSSRDIAELVGSSQLTDSRIIRSFKKLGQPLQNKKGNVIESPILWQ